MAQDNAFYNNCFGIGLPSGDTYRGASLKRSERSDRFSRIAFGFVRVRFLENRRQSGSILSSGVALFYSERFDFKIPKRRDRPSFVYTI